MVSASSISAKAESWSRQRAAEVQALAAEVADFAAGLDLAVADLGLTTGDVEALTGRLWSLGPAADLALRDAYSRWWADAGDTTPAGYAAVGLRVQS